MCGISGILYSDQSKSLVAAHAVKKMNMRMLKRGPDAEGFFEGDGVVLGHRRLAILDLDPRSNQPFQSDDGRYIIVFNGEIYNFQELRSQLELEGVVFRTSSDTEVLLALFIARGTEMLKLLRGMFAFAIWDTQLRELFLARDPYGIKPLYYSNTNFGFIFASQVKALQATGLISDTTEYAGLVGFYLWGAVPEPWTLYKDVFSLPAGSYIKIVDNCVEEPVIWQDVRANWQDERRTVPESQLGEVVREAVVDSVRSHLVSDVPIGIFLSGGIDSAAIAGIASELGVAIEGITISFDEFAGGHDDEAPIAAEIAKYYGIKHHLRRVSQSEFEADVPAILDAMDQPSIDGVNTWFASKAAAELGFKVVLSGVGGDELFCGYPSFKMVPQAARWGKLLGKRNTKLLRPIVDFFAKKYLKPKLSGLPLYLNSIEGAYFLKRSLFLPSELKGLIGEKNARDGLVKLGGHPPGMSKTNARDDVSSIGLLESTYYLKNQLLRDSDWACMAHSLELRTPLVDSKLLGALGAYVPSFRGGVGKRLLAISPRKLLPDAIINRPKTGFSMPMSQWLAKITYINRVQFQTTEEPVLVPWARKWAVSVANKFEK